MKKILVIMVLFAAFTTGLTAQVLKPVKWQITQKKVSDGVYDIICKATVDSGWHLYDTKLPEGGPLPTTFNMDEDETSGIELVVCNPFSKFSCCHFFGGEKTIISLIRLLLHGSEIFYQCRYFCSTGQGNQRKS